MCGYSQGWCDPSTETDCYEDGVWIASAWMGCVWTVDVGMGDMWMGRRGIAPCGQDLRGLVG